MAGIKDMTEIKVLTQGAVCVNKSYVYQGSSVVCAIVVDMKTKRADIASTGIGEDGCPTIALEANEESCHLKDGVDRMLLTEIAFTQFKGWAVWSANISKYTMAVCLVKSI